MNNKRPKHSGSVKTMNAKWKMKKTKSQIWSDGQYFLIFQSLYFYLYAFLHQYIKDGFYINTEQNENFIYDQLLGDFVRSHNSIIGLNSFIKDLQLSDSEKKSKSKSSPKSARSCWFEILKIRSCRLIPSQLVIDYYWSFGLIWTTLSLW